MKVNANKALLFCLALLPANSVMAVGWLDSYLPSWISRPIAWIGSYTAPFMPATVADAHKIKAPIEKDLSSAQRLLLASQEIRQNKTFPKMHALNEDLDWLDRTLRSTQVKNEAFLDQQEQGLIELQKAQEITSTHLKDTTSKMLALTTQFSQANASVESMGKKQQEYQNRINTDMSSLQLACQASSAESAALVKTGCDALDTFDKQIESDVRGMNQKVTKGNGLLDDLLETDGINSKNIESVIQKMENLSDALDRYAVRKANRRAARLEKKKRRESSSVLLNQVSATVAVGLQNLNYNK